MTDEKRDPVTPAGAVVVHASNVKSIKAAAKDGLDDKPGGNYSYGGGYDYIGGYEYGRGYGGSYAGQKWTYSYAASCKPHQEYLEIGQGSEVYEVFLKSSMGIVDHQLDVYIDLTGHGKTRSIPTALAQYVPETAKPHLVIWEVTDGRIDPGVADFALNLLRAGFKVGWGCMGGHGRTGWLAAKVHQLITDCSGDEAVNHVRDNYCLEAVESQLQLTDLGCLSCKPSKWSYAVVSTTPKTIGFDPVL